MYERDTGLSLWELKIGGVVLEPPFWDPLHLRDIEGPKELLFTWAVSLNVQHYQMSKVITM